MSYAQPNSAENRFRVQRFRLFKSIVDQILADKGTCRILDLGGTPSYWEEFGADLDWDRVSVCAFNVTRSETTHSGITAMVGDARDVSGFQDLSFDVVHSNSVIEHVGRWDDMASMAREVRRLAPRYFVQTPYFWFPIEPHARFPLLHWMPRVLALSDPPEANLWLLEPAAGCWGGDEGRPERVAPRQAAAAVPVP